jgi:prepilin-type N-terminal cleavage/methylation domain-containing protein
MSRPTKRESGFSLLEMVIAIAVGTVVLGVAVQLYIQDLGATWTTTQRAELQQDFRAASNMLITDLSLAGAGLGTGAAIQLPSGSAPKYGCVQTSGTPCYIISAANPTGAVAYPQQGATYFLYGLLPGYNAGPTLLAAQGPTDAVTVIYTDNSFYLDCYTATVSSTTTVTFTLPGTTSANCTSPTGNTGAQAVNDSAVGLTPGDLVLFTFGASNIVAEVTTAATAGGVATFAASDALNMNQGSAVANSLASKYVASPPAASLTTGYASRILAVTYYIDNTASQPRLMRQISGHTPMPVAENVAYMKFTYNLFNDSTNTPVVGCSNPGAASDGCSGASTGLLPNQITQTNVQNMAMDSTINSSQFGSNNGYQRLDLQTSVSARNLSFVNNYPNH